MCACIAALLPPSCFPSLGGMSTIQFIYVVSKCCFLCVYKKYSATGNNKHPIAWLRAHFFVAGMSPIAVATTKIIIPRQPVMRSTKTVISTITPQQIVA